MMLFAPKPLTVTKRQNSGKTCPAGLTRGWQREERAIDHRPAEAKHRPVMVPLATCNANGWEFFYIIGGGTSSPMIITVKETGEWARRGLTPGWPLSDRYDALR